MSSTTRIRALLALSGALAGPQLVLFLVARTWVTGVLFAIAAAICLGLLWEVLTQGDEQLERLQAPPRGGRQTRSGS